MEIHWKVGLMLGLSGLLLAACQKSSPPPELASEAIRGVALIEKLPDDVEGVTIEDGFLKLKPGYEFVEEKDNSVAVARIAGGKTGSSFSCTCGDDLGNKGRGACTLKKDKDGTPWCEQGTCDKFCYLGTKFLTPGAGLVIFRYGEGSPGTGAETPAQQSSGTASE
jgi:hypothetical protein